MIDATEWMGYFRSSAESPGAPMRSVHADIEAECMSTNAVDYGTVSSSKARRSEMPLTLMAQAYRSGVNAAPARATYPP